MKDKPETLDLVADEKEVSYILHRLVPITKMIQSTHMKTVKVLCKSAFGNTSPENIAVTIAIFAWGWATCEDETAEE